MTVAEKIKEVKNQKGLSNADLAEASGVPVGTINRILAGTTDNPSWQTVVDLAAALDMSLDALAGTAHSVEPVKADKLMQAYERAIDKKDKWIIRMFTYSVVLTVATLLIVVFGR